MSAGRPEGLRSRTPARAVRDEALEFPRGRQQSAAIHRDRRLRVVTVLLALTLALGLFWTYEFYGVAASPGEPIGDFGGLVIDPVDRPVAGALVTVEGLDTNATTDANGSFRLHDVPSGRLTLTVKKSGYVTTSFTVYAAPVPEGTVLAQAELLRVEAGSGVRSQDLATARDWWFTACMSTFLIGTVMNAVGLVAVIGRRRYKHAMLGPIGAMVSVGALFGLVLGMVSMFLLMGTRDEFEDRRSIFATEHDMPFPRVVDQGGAGTAPGDGVEPSNGEAPGEAAPGKDGEEKP